jgi:hypothetical protein
MKALWFWEMWRKSLEIAVWLCEYAWGDLEAVEMKDRTVVVMKGNSSRFWGLVGVVWMEGVCPEESYL